MFACWFYFLPLLTFLPVRYLSVLFEFQKRSRTLRIITYHTIPHATRSRNVIVIIIVSCGAHHRVSTNRRHELETSARGRRTRVAARGAHGRTHACLQVRTSTVAQRRFPTLTRDSSRR